MVQPLEQLAGSSKAQGSARSGNKTHTSAQRPGQASQATASSNQPSKHVHSNQSKNASGGSTGLRTVQSAMDLKQKVDRQAEQLMRRTQSKPQLQEARLGPDYFVAHQLLGTGSFGEVFLVERK